MNTGDKVFVMPNKMYGILGKKMARINNTYYVYTVINDRLCHGYYSTKSIKFATKYDLLLYDDVFEKTKRLLEKIK